MKLPAFLLQLHLQFVGHVKLSDSPSSGVLHCMSTWNQIVEDRQITYKNLYKTERQRYNTSLFTIILFKIVYTELNIVW